MAKASTAGIGAAISDHFTDVWRLLSETTAFLSRTREFYQYENQLRAWRGELQSKRQDTDLTHRIRTEVIALRKALRHQGYDLSLAKETLVFEGFRNDACIREGFRRLVLFFTEDGLYWLSGDDNHVTLAAYLENRLEAGIVANKTGRIRYRHYLWFKRRGTELVLSGSDTERVDDFAHLVARGEANSLLLLSKLKGLR